MSSASKFRKKAVEYEQLKQFDRAVASYVRAIEESENAKEEIDVALFNKVGDLTLRQGRVTEAVTYYERAVEHYVSNSLFDNAIALCNKILRNTPGRSNVYFTLGRICGRKGLRSDATRNFLEYATRMQQEGRVEEGMRALAEVADLMPELTEVNRLVEEYAARVGISLTRKRATPTKSSAQPEPEQSRLFGMSRDLVFLDVDYEQQARAKTPLAARAIAKETEAAPVTVTAAAASIPAPVASHATASGSPASTSTPRSSRLEDLMIFDPNDTSSTLQDVLGDRSESVVDSAPILTPYVDLSTPVEALTDLALPNFERDVPAAVEIDSPENAVVEEALAAEPIAEVLPVDALNVSSTDEYALEAASAHDDVDSDSLFGNVQVASFAHDVVDMGVSGENEAVVTDIDDTSVSLDIDALVEQTTVDDTNSDVTIIDDNANEITTAGERSPGIAEPFFDLNDGLEAPVSTQFSGLLQSEVPELESPDVDLPAAELPAIELQPIELLAVELPTVDLPTIELSTIELPTAEVATAELPVIDLAVAECESAELSIIELPAVDESLSKAAWLDAEAIVTPVSSERVEAAAHESFDADNVVAEGSTYTLPDAFIEEAAVANLNSFDTDDSTLVELIDGIIDSDPDFAPANADDSEADNQQSMVAHDAAEFVPSSITLEQQLEATAPVEALDGLTSEDPRAIEFEENDRVLSADSSYNVVVSETPGASLPSLDFDGMLDVEPDEVPSGLELNVTPVAELEIEEFTPLSIEANADAADATNDLLAAIELDNEIELVAAAPFEFNSAQTVTDFDDEVAIELPDEFDASVELPPLVVTAATHSADALDGIELDDEAHVEIVHVDAALGLVRVTPPEDATVEPLTVTSEHVIVAELAEARPVTGVIEAVASIDFVATDAEDILDELFIATDVPTAVAAAEATLVASSRLAEMQDASNNDPNSSLLRRRLAEALFEAGNREAAISELGAALAIVELSGNLPDALDIANELVRVDSDQVVHHQKRLELSIRLGDQSRLRDAYLDFADALVRQGEELRARAVFARVLEIDPWDDRARTALGDAAPPPPPRPPVAGSDSDHVNLADWLRDDDEPASTRLRMREPDVTGDEQDDFNSLLKHFKEGVARSLGEDDYESHYDLGVAYKEMGLLDDAIAEFQMALRSRTNRLPAYEALGQCFLEQQSYKVAVTVLSRALHEPDVQDEQRVGVLYLLGYSCEVLQRFDEARGYFQRVYATDIHFRDVAKRLAALDRTMR